MRNSNCLIYIILHILCTIVSCERNKLAFHDDTMDSDEMMDLQLYQEEMSNTLVDPHSLYYDRTHKRMLSESDFESKHEPNQHRYWVKEMKVKTSCNTQERYFYKRLINLLLSNFNVEMDDHQLIKGTVGIEISHAQMEILKNFDVEKTSLREIDSILSTVIKEPEYNYTASILSFFQLVFESIELLLTIMHQHHNIALLFLGMIITFVAIIRLKRGYGLPIFLIIQVILIVSFFMTWWQLIQEAEIKSLVTQLKNSEIPISCQPDKMTWYHKVISNLFSNDDCEKYYQAVLSSPKLRVTPALALTHFISTVILHPISHVGHAISAFITNATDGLPWTYRWIVTLLLFLCVGIVVMFIPFSLFGARFKLGLGPLLHFSVDCGREAGNSIQDTEKREPVQIILQVPTGAGLQAISNTSEGKGSQIEAITDGDSQEVESNVETLTDSQQYLCNGDEIESEKLSTTDVKGRDEVNVRKHDGSGDS